MTCMGSGITATSGPTRGARPATASDLTSTRPKLTLPWRRRQHPRVQQCAVGVLAHHATGHRDLQEHVGYDGDNQRRRHHHLCGLHHQHRNHATAHYHENHLRFQRGLESPGPGNTDVVVIRGGCRHLDNPNPDPQHRASSCLDLPPRPLSHPPHRMAPGHHHHHRRRRLPALLPV